MKRTGPTIIPNANQPKTIESISLSCKDRWIFSFATIFFGLLSSSLHLSPTPANAQDANSSSKGSPQASAFPSSTTGSPSAANQGEPTTSDDLEQEIANWIRKLGDPSYSVRLQAQSELERIGVRALDQLHQASFDPDPQISNQARFLVQSNQFNWAWETDPFPVRRTLANYTTAPLYDKSVYIDQLNAMEGDEGLPALCRLVRYETQGCLAKRAALLVMRSEPPIGQSETERKAWIAAMVDGAMSTAGKWVLAYSAKEETLSIAAWQQRIDRERELLEAKSPDTSIEIISDLRRWLVEQIADKPELKEQSLEIARNIPEYFQTSGPGASASMIEFAQWALQFKLPKLVQEQHGKLSSLMLQDPRFGYLLAESYEQQSEKEKGKKIADLTASRVPIDAQGEPKPFDPLANEDSPLNRRLEEMRLRNTSFVLQRASMGDFLIKRGMFDWAETELRYAIDGREAEPEFATTLNLSLLSQMLHELARNQEAADVLEKYKDRFEREPMFETQVAPNGGESLVSNYYLFRGDEALEKDNKPLAREMYVKAIELAEDNVDAIIGLYRLNDPSDEATQERKRIHQRVASALRQEIDARERDLRRENPRFQATEQRSLANQMNTLAWLITNTEGNFEEALHLSRKACSLEPGRSAYLDTLAHCYATLQRYREAVEQQRKAVALEPHQPSLVNALKEFEAKLQENPGS